VISFQFNELSYATEIAQGMLKRQQAAAMVAARMLISGVAVDDLQERKLLLELLMSLLVL
jgi:hypothetical protein